MSIVENGALAGKTLQEVYDEYKGKLVGEKVYNEYGKRFPLLIKYLDVNDRLSIQVHPDDEVAAETIKRLALDIPALSSARKAVIEAIYGLDEPNTPLTRGELQQVIQVYLKKKPDKKFNPFWTTVKQLYPDDH